MSNFLSNCNKIFSQVGCYTEWSHRKILLAKRIRAKMTTSSLLGKYWETQYSLKLYARMKSVLEFRYLLLCVKSCNSNLLFSILLSHFYNINIFNKKSVILYKSSLVLNFIIWLLQILPQSNSVCHFWPWWKSTVTVEWISSSHFFFLHLWNLILYYINRLSGFILWLPGCFT